MPLKLVPSTPEEVPLMVETYFEAFSQDPIHQRFAPRGTQSAHDFWTQALTAEIRDKKNHFLSVWDDTASPEAFVGFAKWIAPGASPEPMPAVDQWPSEGDQEFSAFFFGRLSDMHHKAMGERPHWYLELLAVKPEYQGKGAASLMLRYGVDKADEDKVECFLDASPKGQPIYERYGFRVVQSDTFLEGTYVQCAMPPEANDASATWRTMSLLKLQETDGLLPSLLSCSEFPASFRDGSRVKRLKAVKLVMKRLSSLLSIRIIA
ncbi:acyl-CoA N-acyltransferase [Trichoderma aethiopicum]